ncbi:hypothetical protein L596_025548 [Steinernema carpocapsae]|uniref:Uncharacterized protein n=1 Tax=Steinernema carpocapsae TaxID=34508 RepID=A0A4U5M851_STECR|nr:hypothetical protein L596_025548 [Steinernema carpocapsae]
MDNAPFLFVEEVVALTTEPNTEQTFNFHVLPELWQEAFENGWKDRSRVWLTLLRCKDHWIYFLLMTKAIINKTCVHENISGFRLEDLQRLQPNPKLLRFCDFEIDLISDFMLNKLDEVCHQLPMPLIEFMDWVRPQVPHPAVRSPNLEPRNLRHRIPSLLIRDHFDEATNQEIARIFSGFSNVDVRIESYTAAFNPLLEKHFQSDRISDLCHLTFKEDVPSAMDLIRSHLRTTNSFSNLELNDNSPMTFADFQLVFSAVLRMDFNRNKLEWIWRDEFRKHLIFRATFEAKAYGLIETVRTDLAEHGGNASGEFKWKLDGDRLFIRLQVQENNVWEVDIIDYYVASRV